ncbi:hypothetical protein IMCC21224_111809 [Puniceibacterium sp. IMCC21224]|nr:hypothetical protein IMCC21224_111809 [Puniceibacterium sp. IMCC21224]
MRATRGIFRNLRVFVLMILAEGMFAGRLQSGQFSARGVCRHLASHGFAVMKEFVPQRLRRVDVIAPGPFPMKNTRSRAEKSGA